MSVVDRDVAMQEVSAWLDYRRIKEAKRKDEIIAGVIEELVSAVEEGILTIEEGFSLKQKLMIPVSNGDGVVTVESLTYKSRITVGEQHKTTLGIKEDDGEGRFMNYVTVLTGQPKGVLRELDSMDYVISRSIAVFFM